MPNKQAGYMTATEFQIASALQPLHAGGVHICVAERSQFELAGDFGNEIRTFNRSRRRGVCDIVPE